MSRCAPLVLAALLLGAGPASAVLVPIYDVDFGNQVPGPVLTGAGPFPRPTASAVWFGAPTVAAPAGPFGQGLVFDPVGATVQLEQVAFDLGLGATVAGLEGYRIEAEIFVGSLGADEVAASRFSILVDVPASLNLTWDGNGDVFLPGPVGGNTILGSFDFGTTMLAVITVNTVLDFWTAELDGVTLFTLPILAGDVERVRINLQNVPGRDANFVAVDNVRIQAMVPEPGAGALLGPGLAALLLARWRRARAKA